VYFLRQPLDAGSRILPQISGASDTNASGATRRFLKRVGGTSLAHNLLDSNRRPSNSCLREPIMTFPCTLRACALLTCAGATVFAGSGALGSRVGPAVASVASYQETITPSAGSAATTWIDTSWMPALRQCEMDVRDAAGGRPWRCTRTHNPNGWTLQIRIR
jgi:hypothetical protein